MKLATAGERVIRIGHQTEREFKIKATAKAFKILSSGLYKDKIGAILRELSANAYDAHTLSGNNDRPFLVHVPNSMEPFLSIRDYGPGLSDEDVLELYTTYFESTKSSSNDYIGALGLGSKSPFSYVKSFTVISRFDGMQRTYDAFIDEDGMPSIALRHACATEDETGLEVIVPVTKRHDFTEFHTKAASTYTHYPVKPTIVGANVTVEENKVSLEGKGWRIMERSGYHHHYARAIAVMGVVGYPISYEEMQSVSCDYEPRWPKEIRQILNYCRIDIDFSIGSLDITAGREELSYDPPTVAALFKRIDDVIDEISASISERFKNVTSVREAKMLHNELFQGEVGQVVGADFPIKFKGRTITDGSFRLDLKDYPTLVLREFSNGNYGGRSHFTTIKFDPKPNAWNRPFNFGADSQDVILVNDLNDNRFATRAVQYRLDNNIRHLLMVEAGADVLNKIKTIFDGYRFVPLSTLPKIQSAPKEKAKVRTLSSSKRGAETIPACHYTDTWIETEVEVEDGGVYVMTKNLNFTRHDEACNDSFSEVYVGLRKMGLLSMKDDHIYAIPKTAAKPFLENEGWVDFWTWATNKLNNYVTENASSSDRIALAMTYAALERTNNWSDYETGLREFILKVPKDSPVRQFYDLAKEASHEKDTLLGITEVAKHLGITLPKSQRQVNLVSMLKDIDERYAVLRYLVTNRWGNHRAPAEKIAQYVAECDKYNEVLASQTGAST